MSTREPERVNETWTKIFRNDFGTIAFFLPILTFIAIVIWLNLDQIGGLGPRPSSGVTAEYFNWHPFMMSLGFLVCMTPAVTSFEILPFSRHTNKTIHGILNVLAVLAAGGGFYIILDCHNNLSNNGSFHTVHGCIGLTTLITCALNFFLGFFLYVVQIGGSLRATLKPFHKRLGFATVIIGLANIALGLMEQELKKGVTGPTHQLTNAIGVAIAITILSVIFTVAKFVDKKDVEDHPYSSVGDDQHLSHYGPNA